MTPTLPQPPFDLPPATRDETAPRSLPIRGIIGPEERQFLRRAAHAGNYRSKSGIVTPGDLASEVGAYRGR